MENPVDKYSPFFNELNALFNKYNVVIDCHAEYVSLLRKKGPKGQVIAVLIGDCEPDYEV